jgi:type IV pilus assembly protein PilA
MKSSFTLIELLIVVAIIGVLSAVGIPMYQGYIVNVKIESTRSNHARIKSFIASSLMKCAGGAKTATLPGYYKDFDCLKNANLTVHHFVGYFNKNAGFKNPYNGGLGESDKGFKWGVYSFKWGSPPLGSSSVFSYNTKGNENTIHINTNIGNESGGNFVLKSVLLKE